MRKLHVTQDEFGFWLLSLEEPDGSMRVVSHHYSADGPAIQDARDFIDDEQKVAGTEGVEVPRILLLVDSPRAVRTAAMTEAVTEYKTPQPMRAGE